MSLDPLLLDLLTPEERAEYEAIERLIVPDGCLLLTREMVAKLSPACLEELLTVVRQGDQPPTVNHD
jgi:hypothetical protein